MPRRHVVARLPPALYWAIAAAGVLFTIHWVNRLGTPAIYADDLAQDYLLSRALLERQDPYALTGPELAARYLPASEPYVIRHVSLHPPAAALVCLPLALLPYRSARGVWLGLEVAALLLCVNFLPVGDARHPLNSRWTLSVMLLAWPPVAMDLQYGQWSILLATLLVMAWLSYRARRMRLAGGLLGVTIAVKVFPLLVLLFFLLKRSWRVVGWALGTAIALTVIPALLAGPASITRYVFSGTRTTAGWLACFANYSIPGAVARFFTTAGAYGGVPALFSAPALVMPAVALVAVAVLGFTARSIVQEEDPDRAFADALCGLVLLTPLVWQHYLVVLLWPLWLVGRTLHLAEWPRPQSDTFSLALLLLTIPQQALSWLAVAASDVWPPAGALILLAFPAGPAILLALLRAGVPEPTRSRAAGPGAGAPRIGGTIRGATSLY